MNGQDIFDEALRELLHPSAGEAVTPDERFVARVTAHVRGRERFRWVLLMSMGSIGAAASLIIMTHLAPAATGYWAMLPGIGQGGRLVIVLIAALLAFAIMEEVRDSQSNV